MVFVVYFWNKITAALKCVFDFRFQLFFMAMTEFDGFYGESFKVGWKKNSEQKLEINRLMMLLTYKFNGLLGSISGVYGGGVA